MNGWPKWRQDLSSTKTQMAYIGILVFVALVIRGIQLSKTAQDLALVMGAAFPIIGSLLAAWWGGKWLIAKNGGVG